MLGGGFSFVLSDTVYQCNRGYDVRPDCEDNSDYVFYFNGYHLFSLIIARYSVQVKCFLKNNLGFIRRFGISGASFLMEKRRAKCPPSFRLR